ncbi:MAG: PrsW family glutamic-type intramembrane protease, partial [Lachnospiraceae bacterium]|nr:PrsW family glutamic-type intramembrane protease [Lachnospiraceae bacterium]
TTIFRSLMPFHFMYGAIMGYFVGKAIETGQKKYYVPGIMIPVLLHTLFDSSLHVLGRNDLYIILAAVMFIVSIGITAFMIVKINRWSKAAAEKIAAEE